MNVGETVGPGLVMIAGEHVGPGKVPVYKGDEGSMNVGERVELGVVKPVEKHAGWHAHAALLRFDQQRSAQNQLLVFGSSCLS